MLFFCRFWQANDNTIGKHTNLENYLPLVGVRRRDLGEGVEGLVLAPARAEVATPLGALDLLRVAVLLLGADDVRRLGLALALFQRHLLTADQRAIGSRLLGLAEVLLDVVTGVLVGATGATVGATALGTRLVGLGVLVEALLDHDLELVDDGLGLEALLGAFLLERLDELLLA